MRDIRLGDDIDDFCVRCKRVTNHVVVSVLNAAPAKVRCRTCHSDHDFRNEQAPPPKVDLRKQALFNEVLKKVNPSEAPIEAAALSADPSEVDPSEIDPADIEIEDEEGIELEPLEEAAVEAAAGVAEDIPKGPAKPAAKPKAKAKARK
jgi:hypothetical protein